ncbi:MAG: hypothetical protein PSV40_11940 [Polaromonas sp.]|uniref:hypothetical protein n=1 Tax=Polaromonas sp. TaxID=1869339 RepID=UPI0024894217|nr:hypothetical protein [Polaromonas sp.]MDI1269796.1 hypothetical protein [Polaromonas sp.]
MHFLEFDYSEDAQGVGTFDAMASVRPDQVAAVRTEIVQVLEWAHSAFPGLQAPLDDGGEWDFNLQEQEEEAGDRWYTLTLSMGGSPQFCAAFRQRFVYA